MYAAPACWSSSATSSRPSGIFSDYVYFSSFSDTWLKHAETYAADMTARFGLDARSHVVEIASNDGYLLQYFKARGVRCSASSRRPTSHASRSSAASRPRWRSSAASWPMSCAATGRPPI